MSYKSILVNIDIESSTSPLIRFAVDVARRFDAKLIGCCGADIAAPFVTSDEAANYGEMIERLRLDIEARFVQLQQTFLELAGSNLAVEWRCEVANPTWLLTTMARAADLIITRSSEWVSIGNTNRSTDLGDVLRHAGRPVLVAANEAEHLPLKKALVAWKDTREARRAVLDAVPLLSQASDVHLVTVDDAANDQTWKSLSDVSAFLSGHDIKAHTEVLPGKAHGEEISEFARTLGADLIVSGAYGHSRFREWAFGGVTRSLLDEVGQNRFMSS